MARQTLPRIRHGVRSRCRTGDGANRDGHSSHEASHQPAEFIAVNAGVAQDGRERAAFELAMQWHNERDGAFWVLQTNMAAALTDILHPSLLSAAMS